jgi:succinate dehydrogenase / fumarate reductase cytochrome b subunit
VKLAYWPGCVSRGFTPELHGSVAKVAPLLDLELVELDRANCCGAGVIAEHNQELVDTLNARTFALAQGVQGAVGMMNICSTCQGAQSECQERLDADTAYREHINGHIEPEGLTYERDGAWWNKNFLWLLVEEIGLDTLKEKVVRPLEGLRVAPFYGCYIVRPTRRLGFNENPERDTYLEQVIATLGGEPVAYAGSHKCCGFPVITMNKATSLRQAGRHMADALDAGADCVVPALPFEPRPPAARRRALRRARPRHAGAALPAAHRPGPRARAQGAGYEQARGLHPRRPEEGCRPRRSLRSGRQARSPGGTGAS